jgi:uncharacterized protein
MRTIIDTDTHAVEAPDLWTSRMSKARWGDRIPHVRYVPELNSDVWFVGEQPVMPVGFTVIENGPAGKAQRNEKSFPTFITLVEQMHPSASDPVERAKVMDDYGVTKAVLYPNLGFVGPDIYRVSDDAPLEFQVEIASAYNDWIRDWETQRPDHFISLACIPYWDVESAVKEVQRCADLGHHGYVMTGVPELHGEPYLADLHWDPLWAAVQETGLPISFHAGGGGPQATPMKMKDGNVVRGQSPVATRARVSGVSTTQALLTTTEFMRNGMTVADLLMSGILPRYPTLKFIAVESGVGWIPFVLEALDEHAVRYQTRREHPGFTELPSFYFHRQVFANVWFEHLTPALLETIGEDNVLFETDFPHPTCLLEGEIDRAIDHVTEELTSEQREKILWRNAIDLFKLDDSKLRAEPVRGS